MNQQDRDAIDTIFGRLKDVERQAPPRDPDAESFIRSRMDSQPGAAYYLAQTVAVQETALKNAQQRISELEQRVETAAPAGAAAQQAPGGSLGSLFGRGADKSAATGLSGATPTTPPPQQRQGMGGGGFLAGAAQTAMGVAGGMMLGNLLGGLFGGKEANAAEPTQAADAAAADTQDAQASQVSDPAPDDGFQDDGGGFFDDGGFDDI